MRGPTKKKQVWYLPRPAAKYPGSYPQWFEKRIPEILELDTDQTFLHLFAGMTETGFRVDTNADVNPDLIRDVHDIPLGDNTFEGAMADPPYTPEFAQTLYGTKYPRWNVWTKEMVRLVKPGGRVAVMHNYIVPRILGCEVEEIIVILTRVKQIPRVVTVQRKNMT